MTEQTDRELLERAARAAGLKIDKSPRNGGGAGNTGFDLLGNAVLDWHNGVTWNPLTDDGDALRLAVRLNIDAGNPGMRLSIDWQKGDDPYAATRRCIVRAAASMGDNT